MKITRKQIRNIIRESWNKYGQPVGSRFQGGEYGYGGGHKEEPPTDEDYDELVSLTTNFIYRYIPESFRGRTWGSENAWGTTMFEPVNSGIWINRAGQNNLDFAHVEIKKTGKIYSLRGWRILIDFPNLEEMVAEWQRKDAEFRRDYPEYFR